MNLGTSGIIHVALGDDASGEPEPFIQNTINGALSLLRTAESNSQIKRVVYTSSSMGAIPWTVDKEVTFGTDSYNEDYVKKAYEEPFTQDKSMFVYAASKALTEKAIFKYLEEEKPHFVYNAVLPSVNFGLSASGPFNSTGGWAKLAAEGDFSFVGMIPPRKSMRTPN